MTRDPWNESFSLWNQDSLANSAHEQKSLSNNTIDFVLRKWEIGQDKELSEHPRISNFPAGRRIKMICVNCHCENNKTFLLINTTFPPSTTSVDKIFWNWKGKKRKQNWQRKWIHTEQSDWKLHNVRDVATT